MARYLRQALGIEAILATNPTVSAYITALAHAAESIGVLVLRSGIVKSNTNRPLSVDEFRGFALSDQITPLVFVNAQDAPRARVFTLVHELAHSGYPLYSSDESSYPWTRAVGGEDRVC